jgi:ubiquinone/menaquinone biosynthesis C-methylase UbiE
MRTLSAAEARRIYDRIGKAQDTQAFYEDRATTALIEHLDLASARSVFEFGCGTGRFAENLLAHHLPGTATYRGVDVSPVMVRHATERLTSFGPRASVRLTEGAPPTDEPSESCDRFVSNFVLDLLSTRDIDSVIREAHRMLRPGGLLGLSSLTFGFTAASRIVSWTWLKVHALQPSLVGGCRPLELLEALPEKGWTIRHRVRLAPLGIPLEVVVAERVANGAG